MEKYQLSKTLLGHEQDVRDLDVCGESVLSCSRDGTVRLWQLSDNSATIVVNSSTNSFINCIRNLDQDNLIASGGKDNIVFINSINEVLKDMGIYNLIGHSNNICSLHSGHGVLISSSWDCTAKVWDLSDFQLKYTLPSESSVLDSIVVTSNEFLTCSADRLIKLWHNDKVVQTFAGHEDVVRKLLLLDGETFASSSNDGTIKIWNLKSGQLLNTLYGHESFVYDIALLPNGLLASSGEDRSVRLWKDFQIFQVITLPCISNWTLATMGNDVIVGSSDNSIRIFTNDANKVATPDELKQLEDSVKNSAISEQSVDNINRTDLPGYDRLEQPGSEGQTIMVKNATGVVEAHQWSGNEWHKIGDVVGGAGSGSKKMYNGKEYDYVFDVDIEDGKPPLKLPYNANDNPYEAAQKFLADYELPASYTQEVVNFLQTNTEGVKLDNQTPSTAAAAPPPAAEKPPSSGGAKILPVTDYIFFKDINEDQLFKGLTKFNNAQASNKLQVIPPSLDLSSSDSADLIKTVVAKVFEWDENSYLIGFDLLRGSILKLNLAELINDIELPEMILGFVNKGLKTENPTILMMMLKFLSNLIESILFIQIYLSTEDDGTLTYNNYFEELIKTLAKKAETADKQHKHFNQFMVNLSTFVYNLSVFQIKKKFTSSKLSIIFNNKNLIESNESAYRLLISFGNLKYQKLVTTDIPPWATKFSESRFTALVSDIKSV